MKKSLLILIVLCFITMLSGCNITTIPSESTVVLSPNQRQLFSVQGVPVIVTYTWTLDGVKLSTTGSSYLYTWSGGVHNLTVTGSSPLGSGSKTWTIIDAAATASIGTSGGTVTVSDTTSLANGAKVIVPSGTLTCPIKLSITSVTTPAGLPGQQSGPCLDFGPSGAHFAKPVDVYLPYQDVDNKGKIDGTAISEDQVKAYYFNESTSTWEEVAVIDRMPTSNLLHISVSHFSKYTTSASSSIIAAEPISSGGGTVTVNDTSSELAGAQVDIPAGALESTITITISQAETPAAMPGSEAGPCVEFGPSGTQFNIPVELSLPYPDTDNDGKVDFTGVSEDQVKAFYYNESLKTWEMIPIIRRDTVNNFVSIAATHFSLFSTSVPPQTWQQIWGGANVDLIRGIHQTADGGYLCSGSTGSNDITPITVPVNGESDLFVAKLGVGGDIKWQKTYGGSGKEGRLVSFYPNNGSSVLTSEGGMLIGSSSSSTDIPNTSYHGGSCDAYIVKTDENGDRVWQTLAGGNDEDGILSVDTTEDGGFIVSGYSASTDISGAANNGAYDCYVMRLDKDGIVTKQKLLGGTQNDYGISIKHTPDGGSILLMQTINNPFNNPVTIKVLKFKANDEIEWESEWQKNIHYNIIAAGNIQQTNDGGYIIVGSDGNQSGYWLDVIKIDSSGKTQWEYTNSGLGMALGISCTQTSDNGYVIAGFTMGGTANSIIVKLSTLGSEEWVRYHYQSIFFSIMETGDKGYILGGFSYNPYSPRQDFVVAKLDSKGCLNVGDSDGDGIDDLSEFWLGTDPYDTDSDDDGILDGDEDQNHNGVHEIWETDPANIDTDGDGIQDGTELGLTLAQVSSDTDTTVFQPDLDPTTITDPLNVDTDNDGIPDGVEDTNHNGMVDSGESDPLPAAAPPVANAGWDQKAIVGETVKLYGSLSSDINKDIISYSWLQTSGLSVILSDPYSVNPKFTADVPLGSALTFQLTVTDSKGLQSQDTCMVTIVNAPINNWAMVWAGYQYTIAIKTDGALWGWGNNMEGQLGLGDGISGSNWSVPTQIGSETDWSNVAVGESHVIAIKNDGSLWAWGRNYQGQLGNGTTSIETRSYPTQVGSDTDWVKVATGDFHSIAIKDDGTLWAWGYNCYGQVGDGTVTNKLEPTHIGTDKDWVKVGGGYHHTVAIKADGTLWAWGNNRYGQLGTYSLSDTHVPAQIGHDTHWVIVAAGDFHTAAIKDDGTLWAWGYNQYGQVGDGTITNKMEPTQIGTGTDWVTVDAGYGYTIAIKSNGTLWAWGLNDSGQLGDGTTMDRHVPVQIGDNTDWLSSIIGAGMMHNVAIKADGSLWTWGNDDSGQLGDGTYFEAKYAPTRVFE